MNELFRKVITQNKILLKIAKALNFLRHSTIVRQDGSSKKYPKVIQLPITYLCNSHCVMCNIWQMDHENEATVDEFAQFLHDPIFKEVEFVGINGGEPSLLRNLPEYTKKILDLPKIKGLNIISNGFNHNALFKALEVIYHDCSSKGVTFHVSISLDGIGIIHDTVRGTPYAFEKATTTIDEIIKNKSRYCDSFDIGCTIVNQNIEHIMQLDAFAQSKNYDIKYRLGVGNKRLHNEALIDTYSVIYGSQKQSAKEFFHYKAFEAKTLQEKYKYYSIFYWLDNDNPRRLMGCMWRDDGITLDIRGELSYCAVASKCIGSLRNRTGEAIYFDDENIEFRKKIIRECCDQCIHDYDGKPQMRDILFFFKEMFIQQYSMKLYRIRAWFL
jgi:MoaA/NifB/PqqE/SkfB family radical SAM enzyme